MRIEDIYTFLVKPSKGEAEVPVLSGDRIDPPDGELRRLLTRLFEDAPSDCDIPIALVAENQDNPFRSLLLEHLKDRSLHKARAIAERLSCHTTNRSGLGLLFIITGTVANKHRSVIARFPADNGILADENQGRLDVKFLERVFMKSQFSFKSVYFEDLNNGGKSTFWSGSAIDKQAKYSKGEISLYWIKLFLAADFQTTSRSGTKRLAKALRAAYILTSDVDEQSEISAIATLAPRMLAGKGVSIESVLGQFKASDNLRSLIEKHLSGSSVATESFRFDAAVFREVLTYRTLHLDNGAIITAPTDKFDKVYNKEIINAVESKIRITTEGILQKDQVKSK